MKILGRPKSVLGSPFFDLGNPKNALGTEKNALGTQKKCFCPPLIWPEREDHASIFQKTHFKIGEFLYD